MKSRTAVPLVLTIALSFMATTGAVHAAPGGSERAPQCLGHQATMVGSPGRYEVVGTPGRDVIVSNGSDVVAARGGNDLICITGLEHYRYDVDVHAGRGDDRVMVLDPVRVNADLGRGNDHYVGGSGADAVDPGIGRDVIETRAGDDEVGLGTGDRVLLGRGEDSLYFYGRWDPGAVPVGGAGSDFLYLDPPTRGDRSLVVDNRRERAVRNGTVLLRWDGFEEFGLWNADADRQRFIGSGADEKVTFGSARVSAHLGDGDDVLDELPPGSTADKPLSGGAGDDTVRENIIEGGVVLDLVAQLVTIGPAGSEPVPLASFESSDLLAPEVRVLGDDGPNDLRASGCDVVVDGGGGDDTMHADRWWDIDTNWLPTCAYDDAPPSTISFDGSAGDDVLVGRSWFFSHYAPPPRLSFDGGAGDDVLDGSSWDDTLVGGEGTDTADGRDGIDACDAETEYRCESDPPARPRG